MSGTEGLQETVPRGLSTGDRASWRGLRRLCELVKGTSGDTKSSSKKDYNWGWICQGKVRDLVPNPMELGSPNVLRVTSEVLGC